MNETILNYIASQKIGVISVAMSDGSPHSSTVHFAHMETASQDLPSILIMTDRSYKKCEPIITNGKTPASFVIGFDESEMKTLQMDGHINFADEDMVKLPYFTKFPDKRKFYQEPNSVFLIFTPTWWRYTDFNAQDGNKIISSDN